MQTYGDLTRINAEVNRVPYRKELTENWRPLTGSIMDMINGDDCDSFATGKLVKLHQAGWPLTALKLMVCNHPEFPPEPEGNHLCLLADCEGETYVCCNTLAEPKIKDKVPYQWIECLVINEDGTGGWFYA